MNRKVAVFSLLLPILAVLFLLVLSVNTSPLCSAEGGDSTIYKLLGLGILHGKLPYVDLFDNKGAYLYLINALGQWLIPGRWGIFILQTISLSITLFFLFRTACLLCRTETSLLIIALTLFLLAGCYQGGNHVEEWMLPFLAISLFLATKQFTNSSTISSKPLYRRALIWGLCFGMVLMLRPNDAIAFFGGIMGGILLYQLYYKAYRPALLCTFTFFVGAILSIAPIIIWYACHGALKELWYGIYGANSMVAGGILGQIKTLFTWGKWAILLLQITLCVMIANTTHRSLFWIVIPICLFQLFFVGANMYAHYFIPFIPMITLYIAMVFCQRNISIVILSVAILCLSHRPLPRMAALNLVGSIKKIGHTSQPETPCPISAEERVSVWNYSADPWRKGSPMAWLVNHNIVQCNRQTGSLDHYVSEIDFHSTDPIWVVSYGNEFEHEPVALNYLLHDSISTADYTLYFYRKTIVPCMK